MVDAHPILNLLKKNGYGSPDDHLYLCLKERTNVSFIYPNPEYLSRIEGSDDTDKEKYLMALIIPAYVTNASTIKNAGNMLGYSFKNSTIISSASIEINGVTFELRDNDNDARVSIWRMGPGDASFLLVSGGYTGGARHARRRGGSDANRADCIRKLTDFVKHSTKLDKYFTVMMNFLKFAEDDESLNLNKYPIDTCPVTWFYLLFEPYKLSDFCLETEQLNRFCNYFDIHHGEQNNADEYFNKIDKHVSSDSQMTQSKIVNIREEISVLTPVAMKNEIIKVYEEKCADTSFFKGYHTNWKKKLWQDSFRFMLNALIKDVLNSGDKHDLTELVNTIRICWPGNNYETENSIFNISPGMVTGRESYTAIILFLGSTDFLYNLIPSAHIDAHHKLHVGGGESRISARQKNVHAIVNRMQKSSAGAAMYGSYK
jgi:hypothetical protein